MLLSSTSTSLRGSAHVNRPPSVSGRHPRGPESRSTSRGTCCLLEDFLSSFAMRRQGVGSDVLASQPAVADLWPDSRQNVLGTLRRAPPPAPGENERRTGTRFRRLFLEALRGRAQHGSCDGLCHGCRTERKRSSHWRRRKQAPIGIILGRSVLLRHLHFVFHGSHQSPPSLNRP